MSQWKGINWYWRQIRYDRDKANTNNANRTEYYKKYWQKHPEIAWALLAHLVSRNAGYQMSDLARFSGYLDPKYPLPSNLAGSFVYSDLQALFAFLEAANFLIFRDVFPALEAYKWAKIFPGQSNALFDMLTDAEFDADPFIISKWKSFFGIALANNWDPNWVSNWSPGSDIASHSYSLIVNEQNQIEDRLIIDKNKDYLASFGALIGAKRIVELTNLLGMTRLCFPVAKSATNPKVQNLLVYTVGNFKSLDSRIRTGRDLYAGLFATSQRSSLVKSWVSAQRPHSGSRRDYNPNDYSRSLLSLLPGGAKYSPPIRLQAGGSGFDRVKAAWPEYPRKVWRYKHLHEPPRPLPFSIHSRVNQGLLDQATLNDWQSPLNSPNKSFKVCRLSELCEIFV